VLFRSIDYNPETGEVKWKPVDESYGPYWKPFNSRYSNKPITGKQAKIKSIQYTITLLLYKLTYGIDPPSLVRFIDGDNTNFKISNLSVENKAIQKKANFADSYSIKPISTEINDYVQYKHKSDEFIWLPRGDKRFDNMYAGNVIDSTDDKGYIRFSAAKKIYRAHRVAWFMYYGVDPINYFIDHIDSNNHILNLRLATHSFNIQSSLKQVTGYTQRGNKYLADISINGTAKYLGTYDTEIEAKAAYESALATYKPTYQFTESEQTLLDQLYNTYPNCSSELQRACHELQVKALNYYVDAAIVQTVN